MSRLQASGKKRTMKMHGQHAGIVVCAVLVTTMVPSRALAGETVKPSEPRHASKGLAPIDEDSWEMAPDTAECYLWAAQEALLAKNCRHAASNTRKVAALILADGRSETDIHAKESLMDTVLHLERLANTMERGCAQPFMPVNQTFARAEYALAEYDILSVRRAWQARERDMLTIGKGLDAAATHVDRGFHWTGREMAPGSIKEIARAMSIAQALQKHKYRDGKLIQAAMEDMDKRVKALGNVVDTLPRLPKSDTAMAKAVPLPPPDGQGLGEDAVGSIQATELEQCLQSAWADYANSQSATAAANLREAAIFLRLAGRSAVTADLRRPLLSSADELRRLANCIESKAKFRANRFSHVITRAHYHLARAYLATASRASEKGDNLRARQALDAAITSLTQGFAGSDHKLAAAVTQLSKKLEWLCAKAARVAGCENEEIKEAVKVAGMGIQRLGTELPLLTNGGAYGGVKPLAYKRNRVLRARLAGALPFNCGPYGIPSLQES